MALTDKLKNIANAVRAKTGGTSTLTLDQMASTLNAIPNRSSSDLSVSGATIIAPAGNYKAQASKTVAIPSASSNITLVSADGRKVMIGKNDTDGSGGFWSVNNSDNVWRICTSIPVEGYYYSNSIIGIPAANVLTTLTSGTNAAAGDILSGKTAYVNGSKITGTIATKTSSNLTVSGATVTVPAGYYASNASKSVATATQATPSISVNSAGKITASSTQTAGYVAAGTKSVTKQLTTQAAKTVTPSTSAQTAVAAGVYTTGAITVAGDADLVAGNIKKGVNIFNVTGTYDASSVVGALYYQGNQCVSNSGGWRGRAWVWGGSITNTITPTITHNSDHMLITVGRGNLVAGAVEVVNDQNLTGVNQIAIDFEASTYAYIIRLIVIPRSTYYMDEAIATVDLQPYGDSQTLSRRTIALDVSSISGSYDIAIAFVNAWTDNCSATMKVYSVIKQ